MSVSGPAAAAAGAPASSAHPRIDVTRPSLATRDRTSLTDPTRATSSNRTGTAPSGGAPCRRRALPARPGPRRVWRRARPRINQRSVKRPESSAGARACPGAPLTESPFSTILIGIQSAATIRSERPTPAPGPRGPTPQLSLRLVVSTERNPGRAADRPYREDGAPESTSTKTMMTRTTTSSVTGRASAMRRMRRRTPRRQYGRPPLLRHQRLRQLPRDRSGHRRGDLPHLRLRPPHPLTRPPR